MVIKANIPVTIVEVAQLSQRDRAAGGMAKVEDCNWKTICYGRYKSVFNHCDVIGQLSNRIR